MQETLESIFRENFASRGERGASVSVWKDNEEIVSLHHGWRDKEETLPWDASTIAPVWSATKGPAAVTTLLALHEAGIALHGRVADLWPELKAARESKLTFAQILSHQSGLAALSPDNRPPQLNYSAVIAAMEQQEPFWPPGKAHGYHPRTFGFLLDEIVRRSAGKPLGKLWNETLAPALKVDFRIGDLSTEHFDRLATMIPPRVQRPTEEEKPFFKAITQPDSIAAGAFASPGGMRSLSDINQLEYLQAGLPSLGGVGSASGLAKFYQILAQGGCLNGVMVLPKPVVEAARTLQHSGLDKTLALETAFTCGMMRDPLRPDGGKHRTMFGPSIRAFGQPGAGGSHAFADPENGLSFAYVMNQMEVGVLPNRKSLDLIEALYQAITDATL